MMKKIIFTVCVIFLSLSVGCDYFKGEKLSQKEKLELAEKCSKAGKTYFNDFITRNLPEGFLWDEPEYHYNTKLNTCLIHIRYVSPGKPSSHRNQVIDIFANKPILYGWFERDSDKNTETLSEIVSDNAPNYTSIEYFKRKDKLFSE
jgi:hypothetical protein